MAFDHIHGFLGGDPIDQPGSIFWSRQPFAQANLLVIHFPAGCQHLLSFLVELHGAACSRGWSTIIAVLWLCFGAPCLKCH
jgi:hypothetical protein